jgi:hypothetical protein
MLHRCHCDRVLLQMQQKALARRPLGGGKGRRAKAGYGEAHIDSAMALFRLEPIRAPSLAYAAG